MVQSAFLPHAFSITREATRVRRGRDLCLVCISQSQSRSYSRVDCKVLPPLSRNYLFSSGKCLNTSLFIYGPQGEESD